MNSELVKWALTQVGAMAGRSCQASDHSERYVAAGTARLPCCFRAALESVVTSSASLDPETRMALIICKARTSPSASGWPWKITAYAADILQTITFPGGRNHTPSYCLSLSAAVSCPRSSRNICSKYQLALCWNGRGPGGPGAFESGPRSQIMSSG